MKITDAYVYDPTFHNSLAQPELHVEVDEAPDVTIEPVNFAGGWSSGKYGPFVTYANAQDPKLTAGDYNVRFRNRLPSIVDIALFVGDDPLEFTNFALPLTRARQLVKKHDSDWKLAVSDRDAQDGLLLWTPTLIVPTCRWYDGRECCGSARDITTIRTQGADLHLCPKHLAEHNSQFGKKRLITHS